MEDLDSIAQQYQQFAERQAHGVSPTLETWARAVANDPALLAALATLPAPKRQPNLVFAALRWHGARPGDDEAPRVQWRPGSPERCSSRAFW